MDTIHKSVLLNEVIEGLNLPEKSENSVVIDGTFGGGGHSMELAKRYPDIKIIAIDEDKDTWARAKKNFQKLNSKISFCNANFRDIDRVLEKEGVEQVDGIILDLGLSSDQLENSGRGFSFMKDEPLIMTMKANPSLDDLTAEEIVNNWSEKSLADIFYGYGEEKQSRRIAKEIVDSRKKKEIKTTFQLVAIIEKAIPAKFRKGKIQRIHLATKTFQALRIAVNDELRTLTAGLEKGFNALKSGGRLAVISFHSLEDRIVKKFYSAKGGSASGGKENRVANIITKKPITSSAEELKINNRARSAKLRILEKT